MDIGGRSCDVQRATRYAWLKDCFQLVCWSCLFQCTAQSTWSLPVESTEQSLGGEDYSWYLERVPGAMARLGVRRPGERVVRDLHQGDFDADERAITVGVEMFTAAAFLEPNAVQG